MGSSPRVRDITRGATYDLFGEEARLAPPSPLSPVFSGPLFQRPLAHLFRRAGPVNSVNVFASQRYDKAICGFLACLQEFAEFAHAKDVSNGVAKPFEMSYKIDGDKVRSQSPARGVGMGDVVWRQAAHEQDPASPRCCRRTAGGWAERALHLESRREVDAGAEADAD